MSNSRLVKHTNISPNKTSPRGGTISKITIHHMAGTGTIESCGNGFAQTSRGASSNYGVGGDGRVGMYVEETDRSWASSSSANDNIAVTIEVANSSTGGDWPVSDKALSTTIDLCVDICRRNGISSLSYTGDTRGNLTLHKFFANTACPGPYLESRMGSIASTVNTRLQECRNIQNNVATEARRLQTQGIIDSPNYWIENFQAIQYLGELIVNMGRAAKNSSPNAAITNVYSAINRLQSAGIINTPDYWRENYSRLDYLETLLINVAKRLA